MLAVHILLCPRLSWKAYGQGPVEYRKLKVLLTNSFKQTKRGPKEVDAGNLYGFAHQAYWGFRFLSEKRKALWKQVLDAKTARSIQAVGRACSQPGTMAKAGYGAAGLMSWLIKRKVAMQVLRAKRHRRYPGSDRPSSADRRMIFLGIAVAAGVWEIEYTTALRKLAQAGRGPEYLTQDVHRSDRFEGMMKSHLWTEPAGNYFLRSENGKWEQIGKLPCIVPARWQGGYIIYGYGPSGFQSTFSRTLPTELVDPQASQEQGSVTETISIGQLPAKSFARNSVRCRCGAEISAQTRKLALQALAEHKRQVHNTNRRSGRTN